MNVPFCFDVSIPLLLLSSPWPGSGSTSEAVFRHFQSKGKKFRTEIRAIIMK
jgi:hypothetical protein